MTKKDFIYEAPEVSVMELHNEGVLCASSPEHEEWADPTSLEW